MVSREEIKKEVDKLPESLVEEVYALLKLIIERNEPEIRKNDWNKWSDNLDKFTPDFMENREQYTNQNRESLDS